jgi:plasmid stabilization system protein ParE
MDAIVERVAVLDDFPYSGRPVPDIGPTHREVVIPFNTSGYVALYRVDGEIVTVVAVRHQREAGYQP